MTSHQCSCVFVVFLLFFLIFWFFITIVVHYFMRRWKDVSMSNKNAFTSKTSLYHNVLYYLSSLSFFFLLAVFRPFNTKLFLIVLSIALPTYVVIKNRTALSRKIQKGEIAASLFIDTICFFDFFFHATHETHSRVILWILDKFSLHSAFAANCFFAVIGILASFVAFFFILSFSPYLLGALDRIFSVIKQHKKSFICLLSAYSISFIAIIRANFFYVDDLGRTVYGYSLAGDFSRHIADLLSEMVHGDSWLADISPLPQFLALTITAVTGIVLLHIIGETINKEPSKWSFIALIPLGLSPYFLTCLSYKYDAPYMALSILASVVPLLFLKAGLIHYCLSVFIGMLVMCMTYQVSSGIFPMIVLMLSLFMWTQRKDYKSILRFLLASSISYLFALFVFRFAIMSQIFTNNYVDVEVSIRNFPGNVATYFSLVHRDLPFSWDIVILAILIVFLYSISAYSKREKVPTLLVSVIASISAAILSFGVYLVFSRPLTSPRAFYGVGIFISILSCFLFYMSGCSIGKLSVVCLSWFFFVYSFIYGNALNLQQEYINFRNEQVVNACNDLELLKSQEKTKIQIIGSAGYHRSVKNTIKEYPVLDRQLPVLLSDSNAWYWGAYQLQEYYGLNAELTDSHLNQEDADLLKDTYYYSIFLTPEDDIIVYVKDVEHTIDELSFPD